MKKPYSNRFNEEDVKAWKIVAKKENRSLTNLIETVMNEYTKTKKNDKGK
jgi:hypothetical protein